MAADRGMLPLVGVVLAALLVAGSCTEVHTVGGSKGWTTGVNYNSWASGKTFTVGDKLLFNYSTKAHTVTEVIESVYNACSGSTVLSDDDDPPTKVPLLTPGKHYFICKVPGHCDAGMKLAINVVSPISGATTTTEGAMVVVVAAAAAMGALIKLQVLC